MPRELVPNPNDERVYRVRIIRSGTHVSGMKCYADSTRRRNDFR